MSDKVEQRFCINCNKVMTFRLRRQADVEMDSLIEKVSKQKKPSTVKTVAKTLAIQAFSVPDGILNMVTFDNFDIGKKWYCSKCKRD